MNKIGFSVESTFSFFMRLMGLNWLVIEGRSDTGWGFLGPKKAVGVVARETERLREKDRALGAAAGAPLGAPPGVNVLAAGFGLNSMALTLNLVAAEAACGLTGLVILCCSLAGPVGGPRAS